MGRDIRGGFKAWRRTGLENVKWRDSVGMDDKENFVIDMEERGMSMQLVNAERDIARSISRTEKDIADIIGITDTIESTGIIDMAVSTDAARRCATRTETRTAVTQLKPS